MTPLGADASYVYGVVAEGTVAPELIGSAATVDGLHPVRVVAAGGIAAVVSDVSLDEFGAASLPDRLNDPVWLERKARAHEGVLDAVLDATDVVPFRFCTIYRNDDDVRGYLTAACSELQALLEQLDGCVEIGVKCFVDADRAPARDDDPGSASSGRAYLLRRQQEQRAAAERSRAIADCAADVHGRLAAAAIDARLNPPHPPELSGRTEPMILNGAYLVARSDDEFRAEVGALAREYDAVGLTIEVTGPWPPYNFVRGAREAA